ncbi:PREDICTED: glutathione S-transferase 1-like [Polistes dominula]|uniref:Glutathione S-transferase 1-like n=1 Tax=Polistes dominula TaxID=743375 RepID=A0ABM1HY66_POLDO|nr:PREDICTED: glutathione S-transferase 1-like [Polistes dominula]XP_015172893.1 PREDICTED: glutathione S-transferase 1-like [Polistes dominula]XP_015172903.1 PREDICTED: glutathione S-transferase 1-like [Polistes dominula]XP_015172912.1 PREDICTED: glutathione S-transferase 1-like [Polistes dominula]
MPKVTLYSTIASPPCRAVLMVGAAVGVDFDIKEINLHNGDHRKEDFIKINPQHTIPTIQDNDFILWDSHAIVTYLVDKYGTNDSLYPKSLQLRSTVWQCLIFNASILFPSLKRIVRPIIIGSETKVRNELLDDAKEGLETFNKLLEGKQWLVGDSYTIADICCVCTVSSMIVLLQLNEYPNVQAWLKRCEKHLPGYGKYNEPGNKIIQEMFKQKITNE